MSHLVMSRREFAGVPVTLTTAAVPQPEPHQPRRVVALGWISRHGGQVTVSDRLTTTHPGRTVIAMSDLTESHVALARITDALFCSDLETGDLPTGRQLSAAIRLALKTHRSWNQCTRTVAAAFANTPATATERESWCRQLAEDALKNADIQLDVDCP